MVDKVVSISEKIKRKESESNRKITHLERQRYPGVREKTEWTGAQPKEENLRVTMVSLKYMKACCKEREESGIPAHSFQKKMEKSIKQQRVRKTWQCGVAGRVWCEGTGEKTQSQNSYNEKNWVKRQTVWGVHGVSPSTSPNCHQNHNYTPAFHWLTNLSEVSFPDLGLCYKKNKFNMDMLSPLRTSAKVRMTKSYMPTVTFRGIMS